MNHLTLRGTHREMGFQWGARLAERGLRLTRRRCLLAEGNPGRTAFREIPFPVERGDSRP